MALHLLKLCVGASSMRDLDTWIASRLEARRAAGETDPEPLHRTRMVPKRKTELLDGGSLYWVIAGQISARQEIRDIRPFTDDDGVGRCHIVLSRDLIAVAPRPMRPFQGWRYLRPEDAPEDLSQGQSGAAAMPEGLRRELRSLGLL